MRFSLHFGKSIRFLTDAPVEFFVFLNGDTQKDFLNFQKGRPVDSAHLLSMTVQRGLVKPEA
jgi:glycosylphosphatidylinositol transamidase (GPIT) subunit GPI8